MISSLCFIPKGVAKAEPEQATLTEEELAALKAAAGQEGAQAEDGEEDEEPSDSEPSDGDPSEDSDEEMDEAQQVARAKALAAALKSTGGGSTGVAPGSESLAAALAELDMEHYDDSDDEAGAVDLILGSGTPGMAFHRNPEHDPYLRQAGGQGADEDDSASEAEDLRLQENDLLILAARNEDDVSYLEVWVYEEADERGEGNLYVHHTVMLPAFPLSVAWLDCDPGGRTERGNFAAVGSFEPGIEIWDMDVLDAVEPVATLGGFDLPGVQQQQAEAEQEGGGSSKDKKKKKKKKKAKLPPLRPDSHEDAVLGLSWNREFRNVLASASADTTVKVWDVATQQCRHTLRHHSGKVQAVAWNPAEAPVLLTGAFDKQACLVDMRAPEGNVLSWQVSADVEALTWSPHDPTHFLVSSEDGVVACFDARQGAGSAPLYRLAAHDKATSALSFCPTVPGLLMTASTDKKVKLWDVSGPAPSRLAEEDLKVGAVFAAGFCADAPLVLAAGGSKGTVSIWDTATNAAVAAYVQRQQPAAAGTAAENGQ